MKLDRVTFTGADDEVDPGELAKLSKQYSFIEWGILISAKHSGEPRYPSERWIKSLLSIAKDNKMNLSLHVCGKYVRDMWVGYVSIPKYLLEAPFNRIQFNTHNESISLDQNRCLDALYSISRDKQIIFQFDNGSGQEYFDKIAAIDISRRSFDCSSTPLLHYAALFDASGGAGIRPDRWPKPYQTLCCPNMYFGYAGGLGPDNLSDEIHFINDTVGDKPFWIDMESKIRTVDRFDLDKCSMCAKICSSLFIDFENENAKISPHGGKQTRET